MNAKKIILPFLVFTFSVIVRLWNLNMAGQTWDESAYVDGGYKFIKLIGDADFVNPYWYDFVDHPPLARYLYGVAALFSVQEFTPEGRPLFYYDWMLPRMVSVIFSSLSVVFTFVIGKRMFGIFAGLVASIILAMLPINVGLSQLVTLESIFVFFFTFASYLLMLYIEKPTYKKAILLGIISGLAFSAKITNLLLVPLFLSALFIKCKFYNIYSREQFKKALLGLLAVFSTSILTFVIIWPANFFTSFWPIYELFTLRKVGIASGSSIAVNSGIESSLFYFFIFFLITTPFVLLGVFFIGIVSHFKKRDFNYIFLILWFLIPFLQSFISARSNGIRYILQIYVPAAIFAAVGVEYLLGFIKTKEKIILRVFAGFAVVMYLFIVLLRISPYYLSYFNIFVGGAKGVYEKKLFPLGWWGEGHREAVQFLSRDAFYGATVGLFAIPKYVMPGIDGLIVALGEKDKSYDYVLINNLYIYLKSYKLPFDEKQYKLVYSVMADGAPIIQIYKNRRLMPSLTL